MTCAACPGAAIPPRIMVLKKVCQALADGHTGAARLYRDIANDTNIEEDKVLYLAAAEEHATMAQQSLKVVVPDDMTEEQVNG